jgi:hypothetical protein
VRLEQLGQNRSEQLLCNHLAESNGGFFFFVPLKKWCLAQPTANYRLSRALLSISTFDALYLLIPSLRDLFETVAKLTKDNKFERTKTG